MRNISMFIFIIFQIFKDFVHSIISHVLDYLNDQLKKNFTEIKVSFYIGFFDKNIFFISNKNQTKTIQKKNTQK